MTTAGNDVNMTSERWAELRRKHPGYFDSTFQAGEVLSKASLYVVQDEEVDERTPKERRADYEAALERQKRRDKYSQLSSMLSRKKHRNLKDAWYAYSLCEFKGAINDDSLKNINKKVEKYYKSLSDHVSKSPNKTKVKLDSKSVLSIFRSARSNNIYDSAIKFAFMKVQGELFMKKDGFVSSVSVDKPEFPEQVKEFLFLE